MQTTNKNDAKNDKLMQNTNHSKNVMQKNVRKINKILTEKKQHTQSVILTAKSS